MVMAEAQEPSQAAQHMKISSCAAFANIPPAKAALSGTGKSALPTPASPEESEYGLNYLNYHTICLTPASYLLIDSNSEGEKRCD